MWTLLLDIVGAALFSLTHVLGGSPGLGIIALSVVMRLALLPWGVRAARRSIAMREAMEAMGPRLRHLKRRYATDPARLRTALVAEYRKAGLKPLRDSGFGLLALQVPLGFAVYTVVRTGLDGTAAFLWIADLAQPDAMLSVITGGVSLAMGLTMTSHGGPVSPTALAWIMGAASFLVVLHLSAGIAIYWASTSSIGILQNVLVRKSLSARG